MTLARAEFKLRYLDSIVGYVWSLVQPLLLFLVMWLVWTELFNPGRGVAHYELSLLLGIALFTFFSEATGACPHVPGEQGGHAPQDSRSRP